MFQFTLITSYPVTGHQSQKSVQLISSLQILIYTERIQPTTRSVQNFKFWEDGRKPSTSRYLSSGGRNMCPYFGRQNICRVMKVEASWNHFETKPIWQVNCSRFCFDLISLYTKYNNIYLYSHKTFLDMSWLLYL